VFQKGFNEMRITALTISLIFVAAGVCPADTIIDPLHGYCAGTGQCVDNGTNSPTTVNTSTEQFGFDVSPGPATGEFLIDILAPTNEASSPFALTGTYAGTATKFSTTPWTTGTLAAYLGLSASPDQPIGAYLPATQALDPGATGFFVYQVDLGSDTLQDPSHPNLNPLETIAGGLPLASYIVAFLNEGTVAAPNWVATANSGAIFETTPFSGPPPPPPPATPEPGTWVMLAGGIALIVLGRKRLIDSRQ
jgi:hypothetical protein